MRAAIYARYSSDLQREASIDDQMRICRRLVGDQGWHVAEVYSDKGLSGASHLRPGFQRLLEDAREGRFDVVVAESLDRISRDQEHIAGFYKQMCFQGITTVTVAEGAISELHIGLKGTMGALFLKDLAQKTHRGLEGRVRQGKSAGGICFGYRLDRQVLPDGTFSTGDRRIHGEECAIVRRIFTEFAAGRSPRAIAAGLNKELVAGPRGSAWGASTIYGNWRRGTGILNNEIYIGRLVWNRQHFVKDPATGKRRARMNPEGDWVVEEVPNLRIIDDDLWHSVKARQTATRGLICAPLGSRPERARRPRYLFSGLLSCGCCGGGYTLVGKTRYGCASARNKGTCDNRRSIDRNELEARVLNGLKDRLLSADLIAAYLKEYQREYNRLMQAERASRSTAERELAQVQRKIDQIVEAVCEGLFHPSMKEKLTLLEARKAELAAALADQTDQPVRLHPGLTAAYRAKVADLTVALNDAALREEAAEILRGLLTSIRLVPEGRGLAIELVGALAGIMALGDADSKKPRRYARGADALTVVAGARIGLDRTHARVR